VRQKKFFLRFQKKFRSILNISDDRFFSHRKLQQNNYAATMASARPSGAPINKSRRRRPQIVGGGGGAARPAHGSTLKGVHVHQSRPLG